jgi:3-phenylpropionate/trans-cinnamate dioxygenase ferredoxin subunit
VVKQKNVTLAKVGELADGERKLIDLDGVRIALFNIGGDYYCIGDVCSHDDGPVGEGECDGFEIECPRHGARFDVRDGKVLCFPAIRDIPSYTVSIKGKLVQIEIESG